MTENCGVRHPKAQVIKLLLQTHGHEGVAARTSAVSCCASPLSHQAPSFPPRSSAESPDLVSSHARGQEVFII